MLSVRHTIAGLFATASVAWGAVAPSTALAQIPAGPGVACPAVTHDNCTNPANPGGCLTAPLFVSRCQTLLGAELRGAGGVLVVEPDPARPSGEGLRRVRRMPTSTSAPVGAPDFSSYGSVRSWELNHRAAGNGPLMDAFWESSWDANGPVVGSCLEYVYEQYYDVVPFENAAAPLGDDYRAIHTLAFGPAADARSIGSQHLVDTALRDRLNAVVAGGRAYSASAGLRNPFLAPLGPAGPREITVNGMTVTVPSLRDAVERHYPGVAARIDVASAATPAVVRNGTWYRDGSARFTPGAATATLRFRPATFSDGTRVTRGYYDEELNYLDELGGQYRLVDPEAAARGLAQRALAESQLMLQAADWCARNAHVPTPLPPGGYAVDPVPVFFRSPQFDGMEGFESFAGIPFDPAVPVNVRTACDNDFEAMAFDVRNAVPGQIDSLVEGAAAHVATLLREVDAWGCIRSGVTACEWSPRASARALEGVARAGMSRAYEACITNQTERFSTMAAVTPAQMPGYCRTQTGRGLAGTCVNVAGATAILSGPQYDTAAECIAAAATNRWAQANGGAWGCLDGNRRTTGVAAANPAACLSGPTRYWRVAVAGDANNSGSCTRLGGTWSAPTTRMSGDYTTNRSRVDQYFREIGPLSLAAAGYSLEAARSAIRTIPELVNQATGALQAPSDSWSTSESFGGSLVGGGYSASAHWEVLNADDVCDVTAGMGARADAYAKVLGHREDLLSFLAEANGTAVRSHFRVLDSELYTINIEHGLGEEFDIAPALDAGRPPERTPFLEVPFTIGPIPVSVEIGLTAEIGITGSLAVRTPSFDTGACRERGIGLEVLGQLEPRFVLGAYVEASVEGGVFEVGVRGEVDLMNFTMPAEASVGLMIDASGAPVLDLTTEANAVLGAGGGRLVGYVDTVLGEVGSMTLTEWDGVELASEQIWHSEVDVNLADLATALALH